jgi:integrase
VETFDDLLIAIGLRDAAPQTLELRVDEFLDVFDPGFQLLESPLNVAHLRPPAADADEAEELAMAAITKRKGARGVRYEPQGRLRYLEQEETVRLLEACRASRYPYLFAIVTVALHTGMRQGEILGLTWDRVDFARGVLLLEITKSGKRREVPMSQAVYTVLSTRSGPREGLVFAKADGQAWGRLSTAFATALRRAKITAFRFHDLRHTCASWLAMSGRPLLEIKELLGHAEISMTMRYAHLAPGRLREAVGVLDRVFTAAPSTAAVDAESAREVATA